ncbi:MAG: hypothetical protein AAGG01_02110 [Planctomycetota bacterium]
MKYAVNRFESDRKWCPACETYVSYLMSLDTSYCAECGGEVRLLSKEDWEQFSEQLKARRPGPKRARARKAEAKPASSPKRRDTA